MKAHGIASAITATGAFAAVELTNPGMAHAAEPTVNWDPIIKCESGGNPTAQNPGSTASGLFQFLDSTWQSLGGSQFSRRAKDATVEQQEQIAEKAYQESGLSPWAASRGCWGGKNVTSGTSTSTYVARHRAPEVVHATTQATGGQYVVQAGDSLSAIAARHGVSWQTLWAANHDIADPARIFAGQTLRLP
jgi:LysM repeat protein